MLYVPDEHFRQLAKEANNTAVLLHVWPVHLDYREFEQRLAEVRCQYPGYSDDQAIARAAYRILTKQRPSAAKRVCRGAFKWLIAALVFLAVLAGWVIAARLSSPSHAMRRSSGRTSGSRCAAACSKSTCTTVKSRPA